MKLLNLNLDLDLNLNLKLKIVVLLILQCFSYVAQKGLLFNNSNNELCILIEERGDALSKYRIYMVMSEDELLPVDLVKLNGWEKLKSEEKNAQLTMWKNRGMRIEVERGPYITYDPVLPKTYKQLVFIKVKNNGDPFEDSIWKQESPMKKK
jgi:hypothetical protein